MWTGILQQNKQCSHILIKEVGDSYRFRLGKKDMNMIRTISKVAKELAINIETVRFYERRRLIEQPPKPELGYRHYPDETVSRIRFIKRAQELGFTLEEIANLLNLNDRPCAQVQELAEYKLSAVMEKIADLKRLESALKALLTQCKSNNDDEHCPIIDSLQP